ncbi:MAG: hypothetical protein OK442_04000 [Thaumarchaeota archaeon]|nr:hypothetical protein [Nitrososphaerota archaeon]
MRIKEREGILIGVGAGLTLMILLVLQSFIGSGLLSTRTVTLTTTLTTQLPTYRSSLYCLIQVPANAHTDLFVNSTFKGESVTYTNGTQEYFSSYSCPQPAPGPMNTSTLAYDGVHFTTDVYSMAVAADTNSSFVAAENGSQFLFGRVSGLGCHFAAPVYCSLDLYFFTYGGVEGLCGNSSLYARTTTAVILVGFNATGVYEGLGGQWADFGWKLNDPTVQPMSASDLTFFGNGYSCGP